MEEIRKKARALEKRNWTIAFTWIKAHNGNYGDELADQVAKLIYPLTESQKVKYFNT